MKLQSFLVQVRFSASQHRIEQGLNASRAAPGAGMGPTAAIGLAATPAVHRRSPVGSASRSALHGLKRHTGWALGPNRGYLDQKGLDPGLHMDRSPIG
jgi:hypothetical protein